MDHLEPGGRDGCDAPPLPQEELGAELRLQQLQLLADPGLAREQPIGGGRDVQAAVDDSNEVFELLERHGLITGNEDTYRLNITIR